MIRTDKSCKYAAMQARTDSSADPILKQIQRIFIIMVKEQTFISQTSTQLTCRANILANRTHMLIKEKPMHFKTPILLACLFLCANATARDFYVSPTGSDRLDGSTPNVNSWNRTGPFKTLARAQQAVRNIKASNQLNEAITIHVGKGTYQLQSPLMFDDRDSGKDGKEVLWTGEKDATVISGGISLRNCQPFDESNPKKTLSCPISSQILSKIKSEKTDRISIKSPSFDLYIDGERMNIARWPNNDWAHVRSVINPNSIFNVFEQLPNYSGETSNGQIHIYAGSDYYDEYIGISRIDFSKGRIDLSSPTKQRIGEGRKFYLENISAALDQPKEWYYSPKLSTVSFIPPKNQAPNEVTISSLSNLLIINDAKNIHFSNLTFQHSNDGAIILNTTDNVRFDNIDISNIGGRALRAWNSTNIEVSNSHVHHTGRGGISITGGDRPTLTASDNLITNNIIHDYDTKLFNLSPAIEVGGVASIVRNNTITNGNGMAIAITGNDHLIEKNEISKICEQSADCSAIYSGRDWTYRGNLVRYNYLHDFTGYELDIHSLNIGKNIVNYLKRGARGIYLDDAVSGFTLFGNLLENAGSISLQVGGGHDLTIANNIIKAHDWSIWYDQRFPGFNWELLRETLNSMPIASAIWREKYPELTTPLSNDTWPERIQMQNNIIISTKDNGHAMRYALPLTGNSIGNNIVWTPKSPTRLDFKILNYGGSGKGFMPWNTWVNEGIETNSINEDPCVDISGGLVRITCPNSPINRIAFEAIPSDIGATQ
ncbi:right-handed parallel beta-helix repeat-containing protein [Methylomonas koyamae]|uniref:right-handed parallel beta-helix repeat-containing protein n=1 Tax=Methylomonas koyamae TaxID=702114 RepID=UPI0011288FFA|nr:right-handed parallel beta-helix repeat-containing protein [Methylomonas koyamae]TPQ25269.1 hypothetical protein C2U68_15700 [Methylomonas koyamae]